MDVSKVAGCSTFQGLEIEIHRHPGVRVLRVVHPREQAIGEHRHDWAYIGLHTLGRYRERFDGGEADMAGPGAVLHPPGRPHADQVDEAGLETLTVEFDRAWLARHEFDSGLDRSRAWTGGAVALAARRLAGVVTGPCSEAMIGQATRTFLETAIGAEEVAAPAWVARVRDMVSFGRSISARTIARRFDLNADYLARAYRAVVGEGLHESARRRRVEQATVLLRRTDLPLVEIALASGFCDQSHMNRCFRVVLGRTPLAIREEGRLFVAA